MNNVYGCYKQLKRKYIEMRTEIKTRFISKKNIIKTT